MEGVEGVTPPVRTLLSRFSNSIGSSRLDVELMTLNLELKFEFLFFAFKLKSCKLDRALGLIICYSSILFL